MIKGLSIKARMVVMAVCAVIALTAFFGIQYLSGEEVASATTESKRLQTEIGLVSDMQLKNTKMLLAAMDSIIDKAEGEIQPERRKTIDASVSYIKSNVDVIHELAEGVGQPELSKGFDREFNALAEAIQVDLAHAIETNAGETAFARLDDVVDSSGEQVADTLSLLKSAGMQQLTNALERAEGAVDSSFNASAIAFVVALAVLLPLMGVITRSIVHALSGMTATMRKLAEGNNSITVPGRNRCDEIGQMAQSVQVFKDNAVEAERLRQEKQEAEKHVEAEKRRAMSELADKFQADVGDVVEAVTSASTELETTAQSMSSIAEQTSQQSSTVASAAEHSASNVQTVASATEELSNSIQEIGAQVSDSTKMAKSAVDEVGKANRQVQGMAEAAKEIGNVIDLIQDIAEQTNLLALNATIEAARAGEAGKGFAVVAQEVKSLANQTAKATSEIGEHISRVQSETKESVGAIESIGGTIGRIDEIATSIASAVEQQMAATGEISRNIQEASSGTNEVTQNIGGVRQGAEETGSASEQVLSATKNLSSQAETLRGKVDTFLNEVRVA